MTNFIFSQNKKIDSLKNELNSLDDNIEKVDLMDKIAIQLYMYDTTNQIENHTKNMLELAKKIEYKKGKGMAYMSIGSSYFKQKKLTLSLENYNYALQYFDSINSPVPVANIYNRIARIYLWKSSVDTAEMYAKKAISLSEDIKTFEAQKITALNYTILASCANSKTQHQKAITYYLKSLEILEKNYDKNIEQIGGLYINIAKTSKDIGDYNGLLKYVKKALKIAKDKNIPVLKAVSYEYIGNYYFNFKNNIDSSLYFYNKGLRAFSPPRASLLNGIGLAYEQIKEFDKSLKYYNQALELAIKTEDIFSEAQLTLNIALIYSYKKDFKTAIKKAKYAEELAININHKPLIHAIAFNFAYIYSYEENYKNAFQYMDKYARLNDSIIHSNAQKSILELKEKYETEKKDKENALLKADNLEEKRDNFIISSIFILIIIGFVFYFYIKKQKQKTELLKKETDANDRVKKEMSSILHTHIGSSFVAIIWQIESKLGDVPEVKNIKKIHQDIRKMSHLLRLPTFTTTTLEEEINFLIRNYKTEDLNINFTVDVKKSWQNISTDIQGNIYRIIQELLSNTAKHTKATNIKIQFSEIKDEFILSYKDNGKGYVPQEIEQHYGYEQEIIGRTKLLNGRFSDNSKLEQGAYLKFNFPIK